MKQLVVVDWMMIANVIVCRPCDWILLSLFCSILTLDRLEFWRIPCAGYNCTSMCFGINDWASPVICSAGPPSCVDSSRWDPFVTPLIVSAMAVLLFLVSIQSVTLAVLLLRRRRQMGTSGLRFCSQCRRFSAN
ncbi:hypothetical protein niasHT_028249 [Heterodera trifolii]|uniref:Uncharacterized protein n=1 Tax=Heterodera trifolii TaxID=157864 RepID=A0ABD2JU28_9BILA